MNNTAPTKWFSQLVQRLTWASRALVADDSKPIIQLDNGMALDLSQNRIVIPGPLHIHTTGTLSLTSDEDVVVKSGKYMGQKEGNIYLNCSGKIEENVDMDEPEGY